VAIRTPVIMRIPVIVGVFGSAFQGLELLDGKPLLPFLGWGLVKGSCATRTSELLAPLYMCLAVECENILISTLWLSFGSLMYDTHVNVNCDMTALTYSLLSLLLWWVILQDPSLCSLFACSWRSEYIHNQFRTRQRTAHIPRLACPASDFFSRFPCR